MIKQIVQAFIAEKDRAIRSIIGPNASTAA